LYGNKRTKEDGFAGRIEVIARLHLGIAALQMFVAVDSTNIASGFAFIAGHSVGISTRKVFIAEAVMTVSG
jgi:hypothetical protein